MRAGARRGREGREGEGEGTGRGGLRGLSAGPARLPSEGRILRGDAQGFVSIAVGVKKGAPRGARDGVGSKEGRAGAAQSQAAEDDGYGVPPAVRSLLEGRDAYMMEAGIRERQDAIRDELVTNVRTSAHEDDRYDVVEVYRYEPARHSPKN